MVASVSQADRWGSSSRLRETGSFTMKSLPSVAAEKVPALGFPLVEQALSPSRAAMQIEWVIDGGRMVFLIW